MVVPVVNFVRLWTCSWRYNSAIIQHGIWDCVC